MRFLQKLFGDENKKTLKEISPYIIKINSLEAGFSALSDLSLKEKTAGFKERLAMAGNDREKEKKILDEILPEAFACAREAARRTLGQRHFDVQLIGGAVLHRGAIAEMRTGEGKTLTSTLSAYLNALTGRGVHVVTVNDYLARRDAVWMGQVYHALGLTVGVIQNLGVSYMYDPSYVVENVVEKDDSGQEDQGSDADRERDTTGAFRVEYSYLRQCTRKEAYMADITYGTNNEFGFDYLRDNMAQSIDEEVQRSHVYAIVDEVDSILIDEARTPLIISAPSAEAADIYYKFADIVKNLEKGAHYAVDEKLRAATLTEAGIEKVEKILGMGNIYTEGGVGMVHHLEQALRAESLFQKDRHYIVEKNEVIIIDEFTGRKMYGRRYSEGLHQAIEAKEGVQIQKESQTLATITFQNYFRMYEKLSGMTGTAYTESEEFWNIYHLDVVVIPTNRKMVRKDLPDRIYSSEKAKFNAVVERVKGARDRGQPVLLGTISIEKNEQMSELLIAAGIPHEILNAKNHEREGEIIAQAGRPGAVTLATNMAGRGVDIILGGNPQDTIQAEQVRAAGGLLVIGTERHESRRIDNQLRGRSGRQGDPGESQFFVSVDDDLMRIFSGDRMKKMMNTLKLPEDMPIENKLVSRALEQAQKKVEGHNFDIRKHLLEYDDVLNKHREAIYRKRKYIIDTQGSEGEGADLKTMVLEMVEEKIESNVAFHTQHLEKWDMAQIAETIGAFVPLHDEEKKKILSFVEGGEKYDEIVRRTEIIETILGIAKSRYEEFENRVRDAFAINRVARAVLLRAIDLLWVEHLVTMDHLRTGIGLQGYGQRDPLVEYKKEAYRLFSVLQSSISEEVSYTFFRALQSLNVEKSVYERAGVTYSGAAKTMVSENGANGTSAGSGLELFSSVKPRERNAAGQKVGRNDPCPCGAKDETGRPKKFKKCHGL